MEDLCYEKDAWLSILESCRCHLQDQVDLLSSTATCWPRVDQGATSLAGWLEAVMERMLKIVWELEEGSASLTEGDIGCRQADLLTGHCYTLFEEGTELCDELRARLAEGSDGQTAGCDHSIDETARDTMVVAHQGDGEGRQTHLFSLDARLSSCGLAALSAIPTKMVTTTTTITTTTTTTITMKTSTTEVTSTMLSMLAVGVAAGKVSAGGALQRPSLVDGVGVSPVVGNDFWSCPVTPSPLAGDRTWTFFSEGDGEVRVSWFVMTVCRWVWGWWDERVLGVRLSLVKVEFLWRRRRSAWDVF
ncbi:hypothetical protein CBR_g40457 [Chara braunii]|uniref:Uncharacterized protein n=1 Tax=Chara braunii TaxID=69332 RepID=A0A388LTT7_CHABU|nr:hypothetical protein CBR_g40457 [Chara braunii]|eukprot:GBG85730.1 hypothetical protein CBR_g40457 [Chara braunii]